MNNDLEYEMRTVSHIALVLAVCGFSVSLILLNLVYGWEKWTIPVLAAVMIAVPYLHITRKMTSKIRMYLYAAMLFAEKRLFLAYCCGGIDSCECMLQDIKIRSLDLQEQQR